MIRKVIFISAFLIVTVFGGIAALAMASGDNTFCKYGNGRVIINGVEYTDDSETITTIDGRHAPLETRILENVAAFNAIDAASGFDVEYIVTSGERSVEITYSEPARDYVRAEVKNGVLSLGMNNHNMSISNVTLKAVVKGPSLAAVTVSSGAEVDIKGAMSGSSLSVTSSSAGEVEMVGATYDNIQVTSSSGSDVEIKSVKVKKVSATSSSGADIELSGTAGSVSFTASSGAEIDADELAAETGSASASSGATISSRIARPGNLSKSSGGSIKNH